VHGQVTFLVEPVDHIADGVFMCGHQSGDLRHRRARRRRHDDQRSADPIDRLHRSPGSPRAGQLRRIQAAALDDSSGDNQGRKSQQAGRRLPMQPADASPAMTNLQNLSDALQVRAT
jgi:hypothetical protein